MVEGMGVARLALEDGSIWYGRSFGIAGTRVGEVVFNTSLTGYQEILTDPSYAGQIVVMTAPQIGNTGINPEDHESRRIFLNGLVVRENSPIVSNWRATTSLDEWLVEQKIIGVSGIDTRRLTRILRDTGSLRGALSTDSSVSDIDLVKSAQAWAGLDGVDMVQEVSCRDPYEWTEPSDQVWFDDVDIGHSGRPFHVVAFDYGIKRNILRRLASHHCRVTIVPASMSVEDVLSMQPDGIFLSNGPGDPAAVRYAVEAVRDLLGQVPIFGICLGHQIMGLAYGGTTYRLKFGHHGGNQPVKVLPTGRVDISAHNHNFAVDPDTLPDDIEVTHINLNDGCCEGMRHRTLPAMSVQYHPEAAPGPHDSDSLFADFVGLMADFRHDREVDSKRLYAETN